MSLTLASGNKRELRSGPEKKQIFNIFQCFKVQFIVVKIAKIIQMLKHYSKYFVLL